MKPSELHESEARKAHELYWTSYINGDIATLASLMVEDYSQTGSAEEEVFFNKKDALGFIKKTIHQVVGKVEMRNRKTTFELIDDLYLIHEHCDLYVLSDNHWIYYSKLRVSSLFKQKSDGWKLIHQHSSVPDLKAKEGENLAIDRITKENLELKTAIKRRTIELEHKNRELEIEAALERVRTRTMAMQKSDELLEVIAIVAEQLKLLSFRFDNVSFAVRNQTHDYKFWLSSPGLPNPVHIHVPYINNPMFERVRDVPDQNLDIYADILTIEENRQWHEHVFEHSEIQNLPAKAKKYILDHGYARTIILMPTIMLIIGNYASKPYTEAENNVFKRFAGVFEQAYTRFLDLQKAEAQAREAKIEAALERVRARAMAMHTSQELKEVAYELRKQIGILGLKDLDTCVIHLYEESPDFVHAWAAIKPPESEDDIREFQETVPKKGLLIIEEALEAYASKRKDYVLVNEGSKITQWFAFMKKKSPEVYSIFMESSQRIRPEEIRSYWSCADFAGGSLLMITTTTPEDTYRTILRRFANVFGLAYRRFADLKQAEAQAREAQIEAALERVRSSAMAMQSSRDLNTLIGKVFTECTRLDIELDRGIINIYDPENGDQKCWFANPEVPDDPRDFLVPYHNHAPYLASLDGWRNRIRKWTYVLEGKEKEDWDAFLFHETEMAQLPAEVKQVMMGFQKVYLNSSFNNFGSLTLATLEPMTDSNFDILLRFARVFDLTYTRYNDLKQAEAQAREATKQASLDRVRGEIASMRSAKDLEIIIPLVWRELNTLGISFIRCGVFIIDQDEGHVEVYLSKPDGTSLAVMLLPFESSDLAIQTVNAWQKGTIFKQHWSKEEFLNWGRFMIEQRQIPDLDTYQGSEAPPESLFLHFIPFQQGLLYVGATEPLSNEDMDLSASLAEAFSIAYARYEDFVKLEKAKADIEEALAELKATQSQLVQQEKLASLGQLTAGIAHEIKNPLNFVNNFSDVSLELVEEARMELSAFSRQLLAGNELDSKKSPFEGGSERSEQGDDAISAKVETTDLILDILDDIEANLRKIHEHGSRADGIVKSMLQHSRGGTGRKEPINLNGLIKEYVNLAYHGMRAGKEPISVDIELNLDENVGEVPLIAEDFSRVILNICNNAFDAMKDKLTADSQQLSENHDQKYEPKLKVRTLQSDNIVTIEIEDNGPGIPDEIKEKILLPFFTTKKGTQGTGLGLSITNDIVKAHGGVIEIESTPETNTAFRIIL
jgi:signal transduction histidine kinase/ketosteroid isomerase-like protein